MTAQMPNKPSRISQKIWDEVFPFDRETVLKIASRYFIMGIPPNEAFIKASDDLKDITFMSGKEYKAYSVIGPMMGCDIKLLPTPHVRAVCEAVFNTARSFWSEIVDAANPVHAAFQHRLWWAPEGGCLVCGYSAKEDKDYLRYSRLDGKKDYVHKRCENDFKVIGKAFCNLIIQECLAIKANNESERPIEDHSSHTEDDWDDGYWQDD